MRRPPHDFRTDPDGIFDRIHDAIDHGDRRRARRLFKRIRTGGSPESHYVRWRVLTLDADLAPALQAARAAAEAWPENADIQHALGWSLLELGNAEEALVPLEEACYLDPDFGDCWHDLGIARERVGDEAGMRAAFAEVYALDTAEPRLPLRFKDEQVLRWADRALSMLPEGVQQAARHVPIFVQDYPDPWILEEPPWDPRLLGLFDGPTYAELAAGGGSSPHVYLFHRNLERVCPGPREMAEQVRITVHHELGHFLGLDEDELQVRGLD